MGYKHSEEVEQRDAYLKEQGCEIDWKELKEFGAVREYSKDSVWEAEYGYPYFFVSLKLGKKVFMEWDPVTRIAVLAKYDAGYSILFQIPMQSLHQMRMIIQFYQMKKGKGAPSVGILSEVKEVKECQCDNYNSCA